MSPRENALFDLLRELIPLPAIDQDFEHPGPLGPGQRLQTLRQGEGAVNEGPGINPAIPEESQGGGKRPATAAHQADLGDHQEPPGPGDTGRRTCSS